MHQLAPPLPLPATRATLAERVARHCHRAGAWPAPALPHLLLIRADEPDTAACQVYEPCVAVVLQGSKRMMLGEQALTLDTGHFLLACADMPVKSVVLQASPADPYLAVGLKLDWRDIAALTLEMGEPAPSDTAPACRAVSRWPLTQPLLQALERLVALIDQPQHAAVLGPLIQREIHYHLLVSPAGACLRHMLSSNSPDHRIARAMALLKARFAEPLRVQTMARSAGMSISTFHQRFKALTALTPLQYQKQLRLSEARRLMLADGMDAASAAFKVGYESPSQFSREYRRLFGNPPSRDLAGLRSSATESTGAPG